MTGAAEMLRAAPGVVPVLETERLRLRAPEIADWEAVAAFLGSDRARYIGGPFDLETAWFGFAASVGSWHLQGIGYWAVEEQATGRLVGSVGVQHPANYAEDELGWDLYDGFEGRGYATEAARAARDWAFRERGLTTLVSYVDAENARSIRVAERLGCRRDPDAARPDPEDIVFRHPGPGA